MVLPNIFETTANPFNVNIDFFELAGNQGYVRFYAGQSTSSIGVSSFLTRNVIDSKPYFKVESGAGASGSYTQQELINFDVDIKYPAIIEGEARVQYTIGSVNNVASGTSLIKVTVTLIKYDGSTETTIGSVISEEMTASSSGARYNWRVCSIFDCDFTSLNIGDALRLKFKVETDPAPDGTTYYMHFDPTNLYSVSIVDSATGGGSPGAELDTTFFIDVPFKIIT